jgi:predicted nucleic acid-binding protein
MSKNVILLDSGPLGLIIHGKSKKENVLKCQKWFREIMKNYVVCIPEINDYEVRRSLEHNKLRESIERLDDLINLRGIEYAPITTEIMRKAAQLWGWSRATGQSTSGEESLDGDVILAATAIIKTQNEETTNIIATTNVNHLQRYYTMTKHWEDEDWHDPEKISFRKSI